MTRFTVNGNPVEYKMDPRTPLLWALRDASNLTGTKYGCGTGHCGACMVDIDGSPVPACQVTIAAIEGTFVTTIEGLSRDRSHPLQQAFLEENVSQCGFCIPGIIMAASTLLARNKDPSDQEIAAALPNLCRCGIHPRLTRAVARAARIARGEGDSGTTAAARSVSYDEAARAVPALTPQRPEGGKAEP